MRRYELAEDGAQTFHDESANGQWVRYSEASTIIANQKARIARLEVALRGLFDRDDHSCDNEWLGRPGVCGACPLCRAIQALAPETP